MEVGRLFFILYTSADSVFQLAAHEEIIPLEDLYEYCRLARRQLVGEQGVVFFRKTFTSIVVQGIGKGEDIVKYLDFVGKGLGFNEVKGCCLKTLEPMTEKSQKKFDRIIDTQSKKFYSQLIKKEYPTPSFWWLMVFRMGRTSMHKMLDESWRDYTYWRDKGWFESDYFYPVRLNPFKKLTGKVFDKLALQIIRS